MSPKYYISGKTALERAVSCGGGQAGKPIKACGTGCIFNFFNLFISLDALSPRLQAAFLWLQRAGGYSWLQWLGFGVSCGAAGSRLMGFSSCNSRALERRLSSCGAQAYLLQGMRNLPGPGTEPTPPALADGFLFIVPPGKSPGCIC